MNKQIKKLFSITLVFAMLCSVFSVTASAAAKTVTLKGGSRKLNGVTYTATLNETLLNLDGDTYTDESGVVYTIDKENHTVTFITADTGYFYFPEYFFVLEGYEQSGWCNSATSNSGNYAVGRRLKITANKTYYARFITAKYTAEFLPGADGEGTTQTISNKTYGQSVTLPDAIFTRSGYVQMGWATTENSDIVEYELGGDFTITGNIQFYPVWIKPVYDFDIEYNVVNFGAVCENYTSTESVEIAITNNSNVHVSYVIPQSESYYVEYSSLSAQIGEEVTVTVSPKTQLDVGVYKDQIAICVGEGEAEAYIDVNFIVRNHTYTDWAESIPATSDGAGVQSRYCGYCGITETLAIPQLLCEAPVVNETTVTDGSVTLCWNSVFGADRYNIYKLNASGEWICISTVNGNELTYIDTGITENDVVYTYAVTAVNEIGETAIADSIVDVHYIIHSFGDWIERTPATCTTDGEMYRVCSTCSAEETKVITSRGGHSFPEEWETAVELTCTTDGEYYRVCNNCDATETNTITAQGHNYSQEWTIDKKVTCMENGAKSHHCLNCDDKIDETIIEAIGHDFSLVATIDEHPHNKIYCCMNCGEEKQEPIFNSDCEKCIYDTLVLDDNTVQLTGYNGTDIEIDIPSEIDGKTVVSISETCFRGNENIMYVALPDSVSVIEDNTFNGCTSLQLVGLPKNVTSIGDGAFSGCTALAEIMIYPGVVSIGEGAFNGFRGVIGCVRNSYAHNYAVENNLNYQLLDILAKDNTRVDYNEKVIFTSVSECGNIEDIIEYFGDVEAVVTSRNPLQKDLYGTGSVISLFAGDEYLGDYVVIVEGDVNGDSVCDALDMFETARLSSGKAEPTQEQIYAANGVVCDSIDAASYQNVVNIALS